MLELEQGRRSRRHAIGWRLLQAADRLARGDRFRSQQCSELSFNEDLTGHAVYALALFSIVFIYLLMGFLFESFILPLSIIFTIPLAAIGVGWIHFFTGLDIDFLGLVGGILLIGVVVNNGIVLIDYVTRLRAQGHSRAQAISLAADRRFRPIMMTALTTIFGMIPLIRSGTNSIGWSYTSFGMTLIGGMTTATLLTLLVVPVLYTLFDDAREAFGRALRRMLTLGGRRKEATVAAGGGTHART